MSTETFLDNDGEVRGVILNKGITTQAIQYIRYSPKPKHSPLEESETIQAQAADLQKWCDDHQLEVRFASFDPDVSGNVPWINREGLRQALTNFRKGDVLVVRDLKRAARGLLVGLALEEEVVRLGGKLASIEDGGIQPAKKDDPASWMVRVIKWMMADMEREANNERTSRRMLQHQANGRAMGGKAPYGQRREGNKLVEDEHEMEVVSRVRIWTEQGRTRDWMAAKLTELGIEPRGEQWHVMTIRRIQERYCNDT